MSKKICLVAGARPNFTKIAPIMRALESYLSLSKFLVHTGQHYDHNMAGSFFNDLGIHHPDYNLAVGSASHAQQTAGIMVEFEKVCLQEKPDTVVVVGDVNSTIAAGLVAKKLHLELAHVEAGLRSRDRRMPEEINRLATDAISDLFFVTEESGMSNLLAEGIPESKIHFVGNVMIDNLFYQLEGMPRMENGLVTNKLKERLPEAYICLTLHRPSNVDRRETLQPLVEAIHRLGEMAPVIFPCHPRTQKQLELFGLTSFLQELPGGDEPIERGFYRMDPLGFNDFLYLWKDAAVVITDSGGIQEETTALQVPCITVRDSTERPVTVELGTNELIGPNPVKVEEFGRRALGGKWKTGQVPPLWDGKASERIAAVLAL